ncbi:rhombosortase [Alkalilimnicola ehrlichii]|nr:rhombosortase [Alkalilimnicola ehrlichii]
MRAQEALPRLILPLGLGALLLAAYGLDLGASLSYRRDAVLDGRYWLLLSGQFVHIDLAHVSLNAAGLILIWLLWSEQLRTFNGMFIGIWSALSVAFALLLIHPQIVGYAGFSGVLHGLAAGGALLGLRRQPRFNALFLVLLAAKLGWELWGSAPSPHAFDVIVEAHAWGAGGGVIAATMLLTCRRRTASGLAGC